MNLLAELKRRNVFRIAGLYLVGAWLATQVAATLLPVFGAPAWVMKSVVAVLAIGFVPAMIAAWIFELTPEGLKRDDEARREPAMAPQVARKMNRLIVALLLVALTYFGFDKFVLAPKREVALVASTSQAVKAKALASAATERNQASIAVLPFVNMSTDAENGFFADGISEELLNVLAGVEGLKVASRTSAFSFKGKETAIPEIARQLGVENVLEGSVRKQGNKVRITAQLIHASSDKHLWSETYDRDLDDIFKVQEEIAQAITRELQGMGILGKQQIEVAALTRNLDAYQSFLKGRARFHQRDELQAAVRDFSNAVKLDPDFAEAWLYLAATWKVLPGYTDEEAVLTNATPAFLAALERAATLLPGHPMVLALQAQQLEDEKDPTGALDLLARAAQGSGQDSSPLLWHGLLLLRTGYVDQALAVLEQAQKKDPLAGINNGYLAFAYLSSARYAEAEAAARRAESQGWRPAILVVMFDLAARGEGDRAATLWDELIMSRAPPGAPAEAKKLARAAREVLLDSGNAGALALLRADGRMQDEFGVAIGQFESMLDRAEQDQKQNGAGQQRHWWMRSAWMPSTKALRENPRFFAIAEGLGIVRLWEKRGYPRGCRRIDGAGGVRLDCAGEKR